MTPHNCVCMGSDSCNTKSNIMYTSSQPKSTVKIKHKVPWQTDDDDSDVEYNPASTRPDVYRPLLPIRKTSSRQMCRRNRRKIGKTNLNPDYRVNMMTGNKSLSDIKHEKMEKQMKDLKVDRHMKHLKLQRLRSMRVQNSPTAIANRTLRKSLEWGGSMGDIAAIVYTDKLDANDMGHLSHSLRTQIKKEKKIKRKEQLRKKKIEKAKNFKHTLPYLLEPVRFDPIRQQDEALRHDVNLQKGYLHTLRDTLHSHFSSENASNIRKLFHSIDKKGCGLVSRKDFYGVLNTISQEKIRLADIDKVVRHLSSRGAGEGIPYEQFTRQMLSKPDEYQRKPYKVKWLAEQGEFFEATSPQKTNRNSMSKGGEALPPIFVPDTKKEMNQDSMKKSMSLPILFERNKTGLGTTDISFYTKSRNYSKSLKPLRYRAKPDENTSVLVEDVRYQNENDRFANYRNKIFPNKVNKKKTDGYRERFQQLEENGQRAAMLREKARAKARFLRKEAYDKPIRERGAKEFEVSLKQHGGKRLIQTDFDHRKHQWKQEIGVREYNEAMKRRGHKWKAMSPEYVRVYGVQPNMGWSIDRKRGVGAASSTTKQRLFG